MTLFILFIVVIVLVLVSTLIAGANEQAELEKKQEQQTLERRLSYTGFSELKFTLKGSNHCTEDEKEIFSHLKKNKELILLPEPWNPIDKSAISVCFYGKKIGYMDRTNAFHFRNILFQDNEIKYKTCFVREISQNEGYDTPLVEISVIYPDPKGKARVFGNQTSCDFVYIDPIEGCGIDLVKDIMKGFVVSEVSKEIINTHPEWYETEDKQLFDGDDLPTLWRTEDAGYLKEFIKELHEGKIATKRNEKSFLNKLERTYGDNEVLERLIDNYLKYKNIKLL